MELTQERLQEVLSYDSETGVFRWKVRTSNRVKVGDKAGAKFDGYLVIRVDGILHLAHRLAWFYHYGVWPSDVLDHKNRVRDDNRIDNLRDVTRQVNCQNASLSKANTSGAKGVSWAAEASKWEAFIWLNRKKKFLGYFDDFESAVAARAKAESSMFDLPEKVNV